MRMMMILVAVVTWLHPQSATADATEQAYRHYLQALLLQGQSEAMSRNFELEPFIGRYQSPRFQGHLGQDFRREIAIAMRVERQIRQRQLALAETLAESAAAHRNTFNDSFDWATRQTVIPVAERRACQFWHSERMITYLSRETRSVCN